MKRYITLPNGRTVSLHGYVEAWKALKSLNPDTLVGNFQLWPVKACEILRDLEFALHDRINRHDRTRPANWRKMRDDWFRTMQVTARALNHEPRIVIRWLPTDVRRRFAHRVWTDD